MKKAAILLLILTTAIHSNAQKKNEWKNLKETEQIVKFLASDELAGRFPFTPGIDLHIPFQRPEVSGNPIITHQMMNGINWIIKI